MNQNTSILTVHLLKIFRVCSVNTSSRKHVLSISSSGTRREGLQSQGPGFMLEAVLMLNIDLHGMVLLALASGVEKEITNLVSKN